MLVVAIDYSFDSRIHRRTTKIEQQAQGAIRNPQVGQKLATMDRRQTSESFDFNDHQAFDN